MSAVEAKRGAIGVAYLLSGQRVTYGTFVVKVLQSPADHALVAKLRSKATGKALLQALVTTLFRHLDDPSPNVAHCVANAILDEAGVDYWAIVECLGDAVGEAKPLGVNSPEEMCAWVERNMPGIAGRVVEDLRTAARHG